MGRGVPERLPRERTGYRLYHRRYAERPGIHTERFYQRAAQEKSTSCEIPIGLERRGA